MSRTRALGLLAAFAGIALGLVHLRTAQARAGASVLRMEADRIALRRELWAIEMRAARLRAPQRIIDAVERLPGAFTPPGPDAPLRGPSTLIVQRR